MGERRGRSDTPRWTDRAEQIGVVVAADRLAGLGLVPHWPTGGPSLSIVCGRPGGCKGFSSGSRMWSGAFVCPATSAAVHAPRACMEVRGSGPSRRGALAALLLSPGFPDPVSLTVCPYPWNRPSNISDVSNHDRRLKREPRQELDKPRPLSSAPMRSGLCDLPAPPRRQGGAFSSTCARARTPRERLCAKPIERRSSLR